MKLGKTTFGLMALVFFAKAQEAEMVEGEGGEEREPSTICMNCKLRDGKSSFLYSYSYCADTDSCLADEWNYINAWCESKWVPGW